MKRQNLIEKGLFPEVLPPCFDSEDLTRAMTGLKTLILDKRFRKKRSAGYIRYVGTKHDGNRRPYATPNPISYYNVCDFIERNWRTFQKKYNTSDYSLSQPKVGESGDDRAIIIPSLSEVTAAVSEKIHYAPYILKTDIAQFFPSIYTHTVSWVAHGIENSKTDRSPESVQTRFNSLDWFVQQCQDGQTRGVLVGPDAFRIIAEFVVTEIDSQLRQRVGDRIIGGLRHVDDFYIGVRSEMDAMVVLSALREILQVFELQINDTKTQVMSGLTPIDDTWAQDLRQASDEHISRMFGSRADFNMLLDKAVEISGQIGSESPVKLVLRRMDMAKIYRYESWMNVEKKLQRLLHHFPHCIDYICLLVAKRKAISQEVDNEGWAAASELMLRRHLTLNHHHEVSWLAWLMVACDLEMEKELVEELGRLDNSHTRALLIAAFQQGRIRFDPKIKFGNKLHSTDQNWLHSLVAKSTGYTRAAFGGAFNEEFEHLAAKQVRLIDFDKHMIAASKVETDAISKSKYGYDDEDYDHQDGEDGIEYPNWEDFDDEVVF